MLEEIGIKMRSESVAKGLTSCDAGHGALLSDAQAEARRILRTPNRTIVHWILRIS